MRPVNDTLTLADYEGFLRTAHEEQARLHEHIERQRATITRLLDERDALLADMDAFTRPRP